MTIEIYTDGACRGNPGPGGWGFLILSAEGANRKMVYGSEPQTTNNRMELTAALKALESLDISPATEITLYTDSEYLRKGMTSWLAGWKKNGWRNAKKEPVKNTDLWKQLDTLNIFYTNINWRWVKAHNGHPENELVDALANQAINELLSIA